jgi:hypothetical protein
MKLSVSSWMPFSPPCYSKQARLAMSWQLMWHSQATQSLLAERGVVMGPPRIGSSDVWTLGGRGGTTIRTQWRGSCGRAYRDWLERCVGQVVMLLLLVMCQRRGGGSSSESTRVGGKTLASTGTLAPTSSGGGIGSALRRFRRA